MKRFWKHVIILLLFTLSACGGQQEPAATPIDPILIVTSAVQTVSAQLTQTAQAMPLPTQTPLPPLPTATLIPAATQPSLAAGTPAFATQAFPTAGLPLASPTSMGLATAGGELCDNSAFVEDVTVPDGTKFRPNTDFEKTWRIQNTGICTWDDGYSLVYAYGDGRLSGPGYSIKTKRDFTAPGDTLDISMNMSAPDKAGSYTSCWRMKNDRDVLFGTVVCVVIQVK